MQTTRINQTALVLDVICMDTAAEITDRNGRTIGIEVFGYDWYAIVEPTGNEKAIAKWFGHTWEGVPNVHLQSIEEEHAA